MYNHHGLSDDDEGLEFFTASDVNKYSDSQPRGRDGKWTSGATVPTAIDIKDPKALAATMGFQREQGFTKDSNPSEWDKSVTAYTDGTGTYYNINGYLREGDTYFDDAGLMPQQQQEVFDHIKNLDALTDAAPTLPQDLVTYRGIVGEDALDTFADLEVGDQYTEAGYVSTSLDRNVASKFANLEVNPENGVVLQIINPKGTHGLMPLAYQAPLRETAGFGEKEWLLPRSTTFDVVAKSDNVITVRVNEGVPRVR